MTTHAIIGMVKDDGFVEAIYCNWDGYPEGVGRTLFEHYQDIEDVKKLISLGDISVLRPNPHDIFPLTDECVIAYHRDLGEEYHVYIASSLEALFLSNHYFKEISYTYFFIDGKWWNGNHLNRQLLDFDY